MKPFVINTLNASKTLLFALKMILFMSVFGAFFSAQATERFFRAANGDQAIVFPQNETWQVKFIRQDQNSWPELIDQKTFESFSSATDFVTSRGFFNDLSASMQSLNEFSTELKEVSKVPLVVSQGLWKADHSWNWDWELKFADWLQTQVDVDFFEKYKIRTDCADVQYYLRWIFARINKLPMASRLPGGRYLTHNSMKPEWEKLSTSEIWYQDKRFLKAIEYLTGLVYTHTLNRDSYPIELTPTALLPGAFHLTLSGSSGHTMVVYRQLPASSGVRVYVMSSTVPRIVRRMSSHRIMGYDYVKDKSALLRMRWPLISDGQVGLVSPNKMPHFSEAQFQLKEPNINRILNPNPNWELEYNDLVQTLLELLNLRIPIVEAGIKACFPNRCDKKGADWDLHSTPSRDARILDVLGYFSEEVSESYPDFTERFQNEKVFFLGADGYAVSEINMLFSYGVISSDPNHSIERRWPFGTERFLKAGQEHLEDLLKTRRQKIVASNAACKNLKQCLPGTPEYLALHLEKEVSDIFQFEPITESYSSRYPQDRARYNELSDWTLSDGALKMTYTEWKARLRAAIMDPRGTAQQKEGFYEDRLVQFKIDPKLNFHGSFKKGLVLISQPEPLVYKILKASGTSVLDFYIFDSTETIHFFDYESSALVASRGDVSAIFDLNTEENVFEFPSHFLKDRRILKYQYPFLILADRTAVDESAEIYRNIKVLDLVNQKEAFQLPQDTMVSHPGLSKNLQHFHYRSWKIQGDSNQPEEAGLFIVTGFNPAQTVQLDSTLPLLNNPTYVLKDNKIFYYQEGMFVIFDVSGGILITLHGELGTDEQLLVLEESKTVASEYEFFVYQINFETMNFEKTKLSDLSGFRIQSSLRQEKNVYYSNSISNEMLRFFIRDSKIAFERTPVKETKLEQKGSCQRFFRFQDKTTQFQFRDVSRNYKSEWQKSSFQISPKFQKADECWATYLGTSTDGQIVDSRNPEVPFLSYYFRALENGLLMNGKDIFLER